MGALTNRQPSSDASCANQGHIIGVPDPAYALSGEGGKFGSGREAQDTFVFELRIARNGRGAPSDLVSPLKAQSGKTGKGDGAPIVAFDWQAGGSQNDASFRGKARSYIVRKGEYAQMRTNARDAVQVTAGVRRLTPVECERLQGLPDGWTGGQSDTARYRQLGNGLAVPVAEWIGDRIRRIDAQEAA